MERLQEVQDVAEDYFSAFFGGDTVVVYGDPASRTFARLRFMEYSPPVVGGGPATQITHALPQLTAVSLAEDTPRALATTIDEMLKKVPESGSLPLWGQGANPAMWKRLYVPRTHVVGRRFIWQERLVDVRDDILDRTGLSG